MSQANEWIDEEICRLQREIYSCEHCASLRAQIVNLVNIRTPDPVVDKQLLGYIALRRLRSETY